jgi:hypothetical protein
VSHESRRDELLLYASGALEGPERESLEAHLRSGCALCSADLSAAEAVVTALALSSSPAEPPTAVRTRLLERVGKRAGARAPTAEASGGIHAGHLLAAGLAAVVTAGIGLALVEHVSPRELGELEAERDELRAQLAQQDEELAGLEEAVERNAELIQFLRTPGIHSVALTQTERQPNATARVFWEWEDYACHLHASGLRPPAAERVYVLWIHTEDGATIRVGTFLPDPDGEADLFARLPRDVGRVVRTSVTEEAIGAVEKPSGAIQLAAAVVDPRRKPSD